MSKLSSYPNMVLEIIEAIHLMYEDDPDIEADCLLCLSNLRDNINLSNTFANLAEFKLMDMGRCIHCGELMKMKKFYEPHPELDGCPIENLYEPYCPNCDFRGDNI